MQFRRANSVRAVVLAGAVAASILIATGRGASADMALNVPVLSQQDGAWAGGQLGGSPTDTIGSAGCAITSLSMLLNYYGFPSDPAQLNAWLTGNGGYFGDDSVIWDAVTAFTGRELRWSGWFGPDLALIRSELDNGRPVIAEVSLNGNEHFVIISSYLGQVFTINDPWFGDSVNFSDRYGDPSTGIVSVRTYQLAAPPRMRAPSPAASPANAERVERQAQ